MSITSKIVKLAAPTPKIEKFTRFLFIGPHPDDIEIGAGATAAKLVSMGKEVFFLICTDGRYGDGFLKEKLTGDQLADLRREESEKSAAFLGVSGIRFLKFSDGAFYNIADMEKEMAKVIGELKPEVILAPDPCVTSECHADHRNVGDTARKLACFAPYPGIMEQYGAEAAPVQALAYYMTAKPNQYVGTSGFLSKQFASVKNYHMSQFPAGGKEFDSIELYLKLRAYEFGLRSRHKTAEGFRVLGVTQMHCLPEAGN